MSPPEVYPVLERKNVGIDFLDPLAMESVHASAQRLLHMIARIAEAPEQSDSSVVRNLMQAVWPSLPTEASNLRALRPALRLVPLERIGVTPGRSKSKVMLAYFLTSDSDRTDVSHPLVLKIQKPIASSDAGPVRDELALELEQADVVKRYSRGNIGDSFAFPLHIDIPEQTGKPFTVLWAPFTSDTDGWIDEDSEEYWLRSDELKDLLQDKPDVVDVSAEGVLKKVMRLFRNMHRKCGDDGRMQLDIVSHYSDQEHDRDYLRGLTPRSMRGGAELPDDHWAVPWYLKWSGEERRRVRQYGRDWENPFWVLDRLSQRPEAPLYCGVVHGDLHPRNIVLDPLLGAPHVIDFGWSGDNRHIAQDFVLMEANLRFLVYRPCARFEDILGLADWIRPEDPLPSLINNGSYLDNRIKLIQTLRKAAKQHFPDGTDWTMEYLVPLFLVSLGLLKHFGECDNQLAFEITLLSLASKIARDLQL